MHKPLSGLRTSLSQQAKEPETDPAEPTKPSVDSPVPGTNADTESTATTDGTKARAKKTASK